MEINAEDILSLIKNAQCLNRGVYLCNFCFYPVLNCVKAKGYNFGIGIPLFISCFHLSVIIITSSSLHLSLS